MKDDLVDRYINLAPSILDMPDDETLEFLNSIEGKEVELVFTGIDAFEKNDNNIWLPHALWDKLD